MFLPKSQSENKLLIVLVSILIVSAGVLLAIINAQVADQSSRARLDERARTIAYALNGDVIAGLKGNKDDLDSALYRDLKTRLTALKLVNTDARSVYLAGMSSGEVLFYVDSEVPDTDYYSPPGEKYPEATPAFKGIFKSKQSLVEGPVSDRFGTWISALAPVISNQTGQVVAVIGIDVDAQSYTMAEAQAAAIPLAISIFIVLGLIVYRWRRQHEQQLLRLRSELVSIASHELRTPVIGIRWATESLIKKTADSPLAENVKPIYDSVLHLQSSIEDILQLTHFTTNQIQKLNITDCNMTQLITEICDTQKLPAQQRDVKLVVDESWPKDLVVACDADKIKRAFHNLISNAIKYTRVRTEVVLHYQKKDGVHQFYVIDHGIGIPKAEQNRVFAGFYRASNAKASGAVGTGLGLYLTKTILGQHHGEVTFISEEGVGTTFIVTLPVNR